MMKYISILLALLFLSAAPAAAADSVKKKSGKKAATGKKRKSMIPETPNVKDAYRVGNMRDPFVPLAGPNAGSSFSAASTSSASPKDGQIIDIHQAELKALMGVGKKRMAIIHDPITAISYVLRRGKLYDRKDKRVPGISGVIQGKSVLLMTKDKDVQWLKIERSGGGAL